MKYANSASGGHGDTDMVYNVKADRVDSLKQTSWVQQNDKEVKNHTQMKTLNSFGAGTDQPTTTPTSPAKNTQSGQLKPVVADHRFMTVTDSYFNKSRFTTKADSRESELLKNHYKFHKGTTYSIGTKGEGYNSGLGTSAKDSYLSPKKGDDKLPGRRN